MMDIYRRMILSWLHTKVKSPQMKTLEDAKAVVEECDQWEIKEYKYRGLWLHYPRGFKEAPQWKLVCRAAMEKKIKEASKKRGDMGRVGDERTWPKSLGGRSKIPQYSKKESQGI